MNPVQPIGGYAASPQPVQGTAASPVSAAGGSVATLSAVSNSVSVSMIHTQVDAMLESIGGGVQDNQMLRMIIGLLILQALLAEDGGNQQPPIDRLVGLLGSVGGARSQALSLHSATNVVQIQQQSTVLMTSQAAVAPTGTEGDPAGSGNQVDISA